MIDGLIDRLAVEDVLTRYAFALDRRDWDLLETCFVSDAVLVYEPLPEFSGFATLRAAMQFGLEGTVTQHLITNIRITVDGDQAESWCYGHATHRRDDVDGGNLFVTGGAYEDSLTRAADGWRIARRHVHAKWTWGNPRVVGLEEGW
jgi:3-phenylpropionate/cinnamic acid dioxygenase small subunit